MRLCQYALLMVIATSSWHLAAGMAELSLFFSYQSSYNVLSPLSGYGEAVAGSSMMLASQLSGGASLCVEPDTPGLSQETGSPGCLPLPESSASVPVPIMDDRPGHSQTAWILPVNKSVPPINTAIPETHEKSGAFPLPCEQDTCVAWDYGGRIIVLDISETVLLAESVTGEINVQAAWTVIKTVDQEGNIIYQWYDQDGHLHTLSEWEFRRRLSMYFQSWLEFLYPEYFGSSLPAGGGWHQWQHWKVRKAADRPDNTGQQRWSAGQKQHQPNRKAQRPVAVVRPVQRAGFVAGHRGRRNGQPRSSPPGNAVEKNIDQLLTEFGNGLLETAVNTYGEKYDGRKHGLFCYDIKMAIQNRGQPLTDDEKLKFVPFMRHLSEVVDFFNGKSLSTCVHSLVVSQLLYPPRSAMEKKNQASGSRDEEIKKEQAVLIKSLISKVQPLTILTGDEKGFDSQAISNLLWVLAKLVENGLLQLYRSGLASQAVMVLLPQVQSRPKPFKPQEISNLMWALAKLVENGLLQLDPKGLTKQAVMVLLPKVQSHLHDFTSQGISNLLWALAKLVKNGLLQLGQDRPASQALVALLPQVQSPPKPFKPQEISNLLWALAKLVENGLLQLDQDGLVRQAVGALLPQVQIHLDDFASQAISNLLWALAKLVENGLLQLGQNGLARQQTVMALLQQVLSPSQAFIAQHVSNLLWALAKLVENGLLQLDRDDLPYQAVMALLPQVKSHLNDFTSQGTSNLLWALAMLGDGVSLDTVIDLLQLMNINTAGSWRNQEQVLWALTVFVARGGSTGLLLPLIRILYDALMAETENRSDARSTIMRFSRVWLGENQQDLPMPNYKTTISEPHQKLYRILKQRFFGHALEMEASVNGLPPVDLLFPEHKVVIEVQGKQHYIDKKKTLKNGGTTLKVKTYEKLGYKVFEIPASDVDDQKEPVKELQQQLLACFPNEGNTEDSSPGSGYNSADEEVWYSADEEVWHSADEEVWHSAEDEEQ